MLANLLNFAMIVGYLCLRDGLSLCAEARRLYVPENMWASRFGLSCRLRAWVCRIFQRKGFVRPRFDGASSA